MTRRRRKRQPPPVRTPAQPDSREEAYLAPARRAGPSDLWTRTPELGPLRDRRILVAGAGGLGAPSILEFVRAGTKEVRIIDSATLDPGNAVRWPLGFQASGWPKGRVLETFINSQWPYSEVTWYNLQLGAPRYTPESASQIDVLAEAMQGVDLVYDATAEPGVWHLLSDVARAGGIPYVLVWTTPGAWGGVAARISQRSEDACWMCLRLRIDEGELAQPTADPNGMVQPAGCADPTFTGTGFDVATVALLGTRLAVATLCRQQAGGYPDPPWDVAVFNFRTAEGELMPHFVTSPLVRHDKCTAISNH